MSETIATPSKSTPVKEEGDRNVDKPLLGPGALALLTLMAGPHISFFPAFSILSRLKTSVAMRAMAAVFGAGYPVLYLVLLFWKAKWYWASLIIVFAHLLCAGIYYLLFRRLYGANRDRYHTGLPARQLQKKRYVLAGMLGGMVFAFVLGAPFALLFLLFSDKVLLTLMPLAFDDMTSLYMLILSMISLAGTGFIAGGWAGRLALRATPLRVVAGCLGLVLISLVWFFLLIVLIMLPAFLASRAQYSMGGAFSLLFCGSLLIGSWWSAFLLMQVLKGDCWRAKLYRAAAVPLVCLSAAFVLGLVCGYPAQWYHSAGKYFEKRGRLSTALWCYEQGLGRNPSGPHAAYLQYRIALADHKLGNSEKAVAGFRELVSLYNYDDQLVRNAGQFLENIERHEEDGGTQRVVLPGVDNPTTYKGAYCVPNSLALVMNFYQAKVKADDIGREITGLASGTMTVDQTWYAEQHGFRHQFIPMAQIGDIKLAIDAGFPVMVYVPQHVFVIVGYDERLETFVTYDVATADVWVEYLQKDFVKTWKKEGATMILAYPEDRASRVPDRLKAKIAARDDSYFQYHLYTLQALGTQPGGTDHLEYAADKNAVFFLPAVSLFQDYPALRQRLFEQQDVSAVADAITAYYRRDYDEALHLAGQYDDEEYPDSDESLKQSLDFLVGAGQLQEVKKLIEDIEANGVISDDTSEMLAMVNLAMGETEKAIAQLEEEDDSQLRFYLGISYLQQGQPMGALPDLIETVGGCTCHYRRSPVGPQQIDLAARSRFSSRARRNSRFNDGKVVMGLDRYGNPALHIANDILISLDSYGTEAKDLESAWYDWLNYDPFDVDVAKRLCDLFVARIARYDVDRDAAAIEEAERKLSLTTHRARRYGTLRDGLLLAGGGEEKAQAGRQTGSGSIATKQP